MNPQMTWWRITSRIMQASHNCVFVCACACACAFVCVCVCVFVCGACVCMRARVSDFQCESVCSVDWVFFDGVSS